MQVTASECGQTQTKTNGEWWVLYSWLFRDSDADVRVVIVPHQESLPMAQPVTKPLQRHLLIVIV